MIRFAFWLLVTLLFVGNSHADHRAFFRVSKGSPANPTLLKIHLADTGWVEINVSRRFAENVRYDVYGSSRPVSVTESLISFEASLKARRITGCQRQQIDFSSSPRNQQQEFLIPLEFQLEKRNQNRKFTYEIIVRANSGGEFKFVRVRRRPTASIPAQASCSEIFAPGGASPADPSLNVYANPGTLTIRSMLLGLDIDSRFYALYKRHSVPLAKLVLKKVHEIYQTQLGIELRLGGIHVFPNPESDPYAVPNLTSEVLVDLTHIKMKRRSATARHLFTANRGFLDAIGRAFYRTSCADRTYATGFSDYSFGFYYFVNTVAHEIGHNLGADHDFVDSNSLMAPLASGTLTPYFSQYSSNQILSLVDDYPACFSDRRGTALDSSRYTRYPTIDELKQNVLVSLYSSDLGRRKVIHGQVWSVKHGALEGRVVDLMRVNGDSLTLAKSTFTDPLGRYSFSARDGTHYRVRDRMSGRVARKVG